MIKVNVQSPPPVQITVAPGIGASTIYQGTATTQIGVAGISPFIAGANITLSTTGGGITVIGRDPPVTSVAGRTGVVTLTTTDVAAFSEAAAAVAPVQSVAGRTGAVTLTTTDVAAFSAAAAAVAPVQSVAGRTGAVTLTTTDVASFSAAAAAVAPVQSVAGRTGVVTLTTTDVAAFSAAVVAIAPPAPVQSVAGRTGAVTIAVADVAGLSTELQSAGKVASVQGRTGDVVLTSVDVSAAAATHTHAYVTSLNSLTGEVGIIAGSNVSLATVGNSVEVSVQQGTAAVAAVLWPAFILGG